METQYIDPLLSKATAVKIFKACNLSDEQVDILVLRFSYDWYYQDIGHYIGIKYRGKPYREGTIRYKLNKTLAIIQEYIAEHDLELRYRWNFIYDRMGKSYAI